MEEYKSPSIHRTPLYRAKAAYSNMLRRCINKDGNNPAYANVQLNMTREEWIEWAVPRYEQFEKEHPDEMPNVSRYGDEGHYELVNIQIVTASVNQSEHRGRGIGRVRPDGTKRCCICKDVKGIGEYNKNKTLLDGLSSLCKDCQRKYKQTSKP